MPFWILPSQNDILLKMSASESNIKCSISWSNEGYYKTVPSTVESKPNTPLGFRKLNSKPDFVIMDLDRSVNFCGITTWDSNLGKC